MLTYIRLTNQTMPWFQPLFPQGDRAWSEDSDMYAIGAIQDGVACGILIFQMIQEWADIRFLAVAEGYRRQGIATGLVRYLCQNALPSLTPILCTFAAADKCDPVYLLFAEMGYFSLEEQEGYACQVPIADLGHNQMLAALRGRGRTPRKFFDLTAAERRQFLLTLERQGVYYLHGMDESALLPSLCLYTQGEHGNTAAVFLSGPGPDLELSCAWSVQGGQNDLMGLLAYAATQLPQEGTLRINAVTPISAAIVDKLLPQRVITARYYQAAWDMELY